jgi:hypothetical protein
MVMDVAVLMRLETLGNEQNIGQPGEEIHW